ncbi:MAG TPA: HDOD domain-containing protein [Noviherbaspirillum sp.]|uniref:EAL and HDOD domain-containing protein n=1 Tax=Noviherbaspirillum sp. TaxID=1926288 RepID=UPI002D660FFE|nr:HDOD domain-containing protein [Noviherbaspirillum sp.]HYD96180.1 HDOD domain-containing protein [Noviherbaspirillum sp.]
MPAVPLLSVDLLADKNRKPAALLLGIGDGAPGLLQPLLEQEDFVQLAQRFPCLAYRPGLAAEMASALAAAGCTLVEPEVILHADAACAPGLPPQVRWLAGRWYLAPPAKPGRGQAASRALALQLVQLVSADADTHEIEAVLRRDPALSYHLLRLVNSLGMGMSRQITSFAQAILILGRAQLRRWLNLMLFSARSGDERSPMLLARVAVRARLMELLARETGLDKSGQETAFMAGMFSLLGILFGMPLEEVLRPLKISDHLMGALLRHEGDVGRLLTLVEAAERSELDVLAAGLAAVPVAHTDFNLLIVQAHLWMLDVVRESGGGAHA